MDKITKLDYKSRINRVIDYIEYNISNEFTLEELSKIANFSKYHFHRIFYYLTGENLFQFILRMRLERAAIILQTNYKSTITDVAIKCGFTNSAIFSRSFKKYFKITARDFRNSKSYYSNPDQLNSNQSQIKGNQWKELNNKNWYIKPINNGKKWIVTGDERIKYVEIKDLDDVNVIYVRHIGAYKYNQDLFIKMFDKLYKWAYSRNLVNENTKEIIIYHDSPDITNENKLRVSTCITVPSEIEVSGEIGNLTFKKGKYAIIRFEISVNDFFFAWDWVYRQWLPQSGYLPDDNYCYEMYQNKPSDSIFIVDIYVPIIPE